MGIHQEDKKKRKRKREISGKGRREVDDWYETRDRSEVGSRVNLVARLRDTL